MSRNRQSRINEEIRDILSDLIRSLKDPRISGLVSVIRCEVTGDLKYCKAFVSLYCDDEKQKDVMKGLKSAAGWLRREIGQRIEIRCVPEIIFVQDSSISHGAEISRILNSLNVSGGSTDESDA